MLQIPADVRAVHSEDVVSVCTFDMMSLCKRLSEVSAYEVLVAHLCPKGGASCLPVEIAAEAHSIDVSTVIVELHLLRLIPIAFISVTVLIPVDAWCEVHFSHLCLSLDGGVYLRGVLILVVGLPFG